ncbi:MAG: CvpA family protein [Alphaproteobacteria bacterium]|nr:CvpA family protein [Alphaproteobacteria bacterium]
MDMGYSQFNTFDLLILVTLGFSLLIGFARGFVREVFGLCAWLGAALVAKQDFQWPKDFFAQWIDNPSILQAAGFFLVFCLTLVVFLFLAQWLSMVVQKSFAKTVDQSLGLVFGFVRGLSLICGSYVGALILFPSDKIPIIVTCSKSATWLNHAAFFCAKHLPESLKKNELLIKNLKDLDLSPIHSNALTQSLSAPKPESVD